MARRQTASSEPPSAPIAARNKEAASIGVLEGEILRIIWDAGAAQSSVQVYETMHWERRHKRREMASPSTIAVTLSRMVEKGLLTVERRPRGGKGYYGPTRTRAEVAASILDDVSRRLTGQPLGYLLTLYSASSSAEGKQASGEETGRDLSALIQELRRRAAEDVEPSPPQE